ncbi:MAG: fibronectin type III domain-containing protein, partial [Bacteroidia bacterium]|nr:fibronectin type III domain-containing protein [Bacteroidia bacterium]MDW8159178.1 fibronectin type III domain-containing protein [Bacteroidia bacterium]
TSRAVSLQVQVVPLPPAPLIRSNSPLCEGQELNLRANELNGAVVVWESPEGEQIVANSIQRRAEISLKGTWRVWQIVSGCTSAMATLEVDIQPIPEPLSIVSNAPICAGSTLILSTNFIVGAEYEWSGPGDFSSQLVSPSIPNAGVANAGLYSVRAKIGNCYTPIAQLFVPIRPQPSPLVIRTNQPVCQGKTLQLQAISQEENATIYWSGPSGFASTLTNPVIYNASFSNAGVYSAVAIVGSCTSEVSAVRIEVLAAPTNLVATSNGPLCEGESLLLSASSIAGATYIWQGPRGFMSMEQNPVLWNVTTAHAGVYSVTAQLGRCLSEVVTVPVTIWPAPSAIRAMNNGPICAGQTLQLSATLVPGATYQWSGPNGFNSNEINPTLSNAQPTQSGIYTLSVQLGSCVAPIATTQVVIEPAPLSVVPVATSPVCVGQVVILSVAPQLGVVYNWTGPAGFSANGAEVRINNIQTFQAGEYSVVATLGNCALVPATVQVSVQNTIPNFTLPALGPVCSGDTIKILAPTFPNSRYLWSGPTGTLPEGNPLVLAGVDESASGPYTLRIIQGACTSNAVSTRVRVLPPVPVPNIIHNAPICKGARLELSTVTQEGYRYTWKGPRGISFTGSHWQIERVDETAAGTYFLQAIAANGCTSLAASTQVEVKGAKAEFMVGDESICQGQTAWLEIAFHGDAPYNLTYLENNSVKGAFINAPFWALPVMPTQTTTYALQSITDASGCVVSLNERKVITVHNTPTLRLYDPGFACHGETGYIPIEVGGIENNTPWSLVYQEGNVLKTFSGSGPGFFEIPTASITEALPIEIISINNTQGDCPQVFDNMRATIYPRALPSATLFSQRKQQCAGQTAFMPINVTGQGPWVIGAQINGVQEYIYAGRAGQTGPILLQLPFSFAQNTTVLLNSLQDGNGCTASLNQVWEVEVLAAPSASFVGTEASVCQGQSARLSLSLTGKGPWSVSYILNGIAMEPWQVGSSLAPSTFVWDTTIIPNANRVYTLTQVTDANGCTAPVNSSFIIKVQALPQVNVSNIAAAACNGSSVVVNAFTEGAQSLVYRLAGKENNTGVFVQVPAGQHLLQVINGSCIVEQIVKVESFTISGLAINSISGNVAHLSWNTYSGIDRLNALYRVAGESEWQKVPVVPGSNTVQISGLRSGLTYEFAIEPICNNGTLLPTSSIVQGKVPENEPCPGPRNLNIQNITDNSAVVNWNANNFGDVCYILAYGPSSENPTLWNEMLVPGGITQTFLSGLLPGTTYGVRIRTNCTACSRFSGLQSSWVGPISFTTQGLKNAAQVFSNGVNALVYPNPSSGNVSIEYTTSSEEKVKIVLSNITGKVVFEQEQEVVSGTNILLYNFDIPTGVYLLTLTQGQEQLHFRLQIHR